MTPELYLLTHGFKARQLLVISTQKRKQPERKSKTSSINTLRNLNAFGLRDRFLFEVRTFLIKRYLFLLRPSPLILPLLNQLFMYIYIKIAVGKL